jgi:hypothetical protein
LFSWPLPLHPTDALLGPVSSDVGVYVWNLWVFRHEIVSHHRLPFFTSEILSLSPAVPLTLHNYTTLANVVAFPLLPLLGTVATFNALLVGSSALAAYVMYLFARRLVADAGAAWVAGLAFGFAPFMSARAMEHFSLVQTAPLPVFALLFERLHSRPGVGVATAAGATVAVAYLCDPYYAVYCLLAGAFGVAYSAIVIRPERPPVPGSRARLVLDLALVCLAGLIAGMVLRGGGRMDLFGLRISMTRLYTPVLLFTVLLAVRQWLVVRARVSWVFPARLPAVRVFVAAGAACLLLLSPVLLALLPAAGESQLWNPKVLWRSSPAGLDLLALFAPNPLHPWFGAAFAERARQLPGGLVENVGSIPWVLVAVLVAAVSGARARLPRYWLAFTAFFGWLALGPFVQIGGHMTYVPTPWALLRYVPVLGAARMPSRMMALVMLGAAVLLAFALRDIRRGARRPGLAAALVAGALLFELLPAPRTLHSAAVPAVTHIIAADPRDVRVLNLPFGMRDGLSSHGNITAAAQFNQTVHQKPLLGGYLSRLRRRDVAEYRRMTVTGALLDLSEGRTLPDERRRRVIERAHEIVSRLNVGYVVVNTAHASGELVDFAREAFDLTLVASDGGLDLYRTPLAPPLGPVPAEPDRKPGPHR